MKNEYDDEEFFTRYAEMPRSKKGLAGAGEWGLLEPLIPKLNGKDVLDLGCGYGWHSKYAAKVGAKSVLAIDLSEKMIAAAKKLNADEKITYRVCGADEFEFPENVFDFVISNLVLHYIADLNAVYKKVYRSLKPNGVFLFNIEHPVFTSGVGQDFIYEDGKPKFWAIDDYFYSGERVTDFLGCKVIKQHHTLNQILGDILDCGFTLQSVKEVVPPRDIEGYETEMRRPMMLIVKAVSNKIDE